jgi:hypothetical protein
MISALPDVTDWANAAVPVISTPADRAIRVFM